MDKVLSPDSIRTNCNIIRVIHFAGVLSYICDEKYKLSSDVISDSTLRELSTCLLLSYRFSLIEKYQVVTWESSKRNHPWNQVTFNLVH